jgi:hypothetical protein
MSIDFHQCEYGDVYSLNKMVAFFFIVKSLPEETTYFGTVAKEPLLKGKAKYV